MLLSIGLVGSLQGSTKASEAPVSITTQPLTPYVRTFQFQQNSTDFSPWLLYPGGNNTVWIVAYGNGKNQASQIVNFTLESGKFNRVATLHNIYPSEIIYDNITTDNAKRVWILENDSLAYYNPTIKNITVAVTFARGSPWYMTIDHQDHFWITLTGPDQIAEYEPGGSLTYHAVTNSCTLATYGCGLQGISLDPRDDSIWFAEIYVGRIGHMTCISSTFCSMTDYGPPSGIDTSGLIQVAADKNGVVWFTLHAGNEFGSFNPSTEEWRIFPIGYCPDSYLNGCATGLPNAIALDPQGQVWFSEHIAGRIARFVPSYATNSPKYGSLIEYMMPTSSAVCVRKCPPLCWWMWPGANELVWFVSAGLGEIGYVNATVPLPFSVDSVSDVTVVQGVSANIPVSVTYTGIIPDLNMSITRTDLTADPPMLSWTVGPEGNSNTGNIENSAIRLSAAWSSTLESRYVAITAFDENLTVNALVRVDVVASLSAYATIGFAGGISAFSLITVSMTFVSRKNLKKIRQHDNKSPKS